MALYTCTHANDTIGARVVVRNRMLVSLRGGGGELGNLKP
jgi:hypothetical protein